MGRRRFSAEPHAPKHQQVFESLSRDILSGKYKPGHKVPSEAALVQQFQTSRITVGRALRDLVQRGLIERVAGSGTYVRQAPVPENSRLFGLLIPDLGATEIFEPICRGIAAAPQAVEHALVWGTVAAGAASLEDQALQLCDQFLERGLAGVFFAPLERSPKAHRVNLEILARLDEARIPVILLDRCVLSFPNRGRYDLVGIDNRRAGFMAAQHLLRLGVPGLAFVGYAGSAPTVEARAAGFREAVFANGLTAEQGPVHLLDAITESTIRPMLARKRLGRAFVCANDRTAGHLMQVVQRLGYEIPRDVRIVGIDDVEYASLLPVPLTTVHQPCREIGEAAMAAMLDRIARPGMPARDILVECRLIVRQSCGATRKRPKSESIR